MTVKQMQCLLTYFGCYAGAIDGIWGRLSIEGTEKFQNAVGLQVDGVCGPGTQAKLREMIATGEELPEAAKEENTPTTGTFWDEIEFFGPEEMECKCGGKYCDGYPHEIQPLLMQILDRARRWSGHPIVIVSGLRCETWNTIQGGVDNSQHKFGEAADVYFYGKTPGAALAWLQSQPDVRYAYQIAGSNNIHFDIQPVGR